MTSEDRLVNTHTQNQQPAHAVMLIALGDDHYAAVLLDDDGEILDAAAGTADDCAAWCLAHA